MNDRSASRSSGEKKGTWFSERDMERVKIISAGNEKLRKKRRKKNYG